MEISAAHPSVAATASTTVGNEVQKKAQEVQEQTAAALIQSVPDPDSALGHKIDVNA